MRSDLPREPNAAGKPKAAAQGKAATAPAKPKAKPKAKAKTKARAKTQVAPVAGLEEAESAEADGPHMRPLTGCAKCRWQAGCAMCKNPNFRAAGPRAKIARLE